MEVRGHVGEAALPFGLRLLFQAISHVGALAFAHGVFDQAEAVLLKVSPGLVDVLGLPRQVVEHPPVVVLTPHRRVVVGGAVQAAALGAPSGLEQRAPETLVERPVGTHGGHAVAAYRGFEPGIVLVHGAKGFAGREPLGVRHPGVVVG